MATKKTSKAKAKASTKKKPAASAARKKAAPAKASSAKKPAAKVSAKKPATKASAKKAAAKPSAKAALKKATKAKASPRGAAKPPRKAKRPTLKPKAPAKARVSKPKPPPVANPEALELAQRIAAMALDKKAADVTIIDTADRAPAVGYDYVVVATGESDRQLAAIADGVDEALRPLGHRPLSLEQSEDWVAMDYGSVITHLFSAERRSTTNLEGLWASAPRVPLMSGGAIEAR